MPLNLIVILIFITAMIFISILYRKSTLDNLEMLPGETVLFEEKGVKVEQCGAPQTTVFLNCIVRITDRRIIIAQKFLFSKSRYGLRFVITCDGADDPDFLNSSLKKGYLNFKIRRSEVRLKSEDCRSFVRIDIPGSVLTKGAFVEFSTSFIEEYSRIFKT